MRVLGFLFKYHPIAGQGMERVIWFKTSQFYCIVLKSFHFIRTHCMYPKSYGTSYGKETSITALNIIIVQLYAKFGNFILITKSISL